MEYSTYFINQWTKKRQTKINGKILKIISYFERETSGVCVWFIIIIFFAVYFLFGRFCFATARCGDCGRIRQCQQQQYDANLHIYQRIMNTFASPCLHRLLTSTKHLPCGFSSSFILLSFFFFGNFESQNIQSHNNNSKTKLFSFLTKQMVLFRIDV